MPTLVAAQHFFTSVPVEQSPTKKRGYQTLFRTRGLSDEAIRAIEDRAQYVTAPGDPMKRQFYPLPGGLVAISQIVALAELDEFGRKGRYLAHTLILLGQDLQPLGMCPLDVFTQFHFAATLAEVFQQGQPSSVDAPPVQLNISPNWHAKAYQAIQQWTPEALPRLGRLAWQAGRLVEKREPVAVIGTEADQMEVLGVLFLLVSSVQRPQLSFDTHAAGCEWGREITFWVLGYADPSEARTTHTIDARGHARTVSSSLSPADDGPFAVWMMKEALPARLNLNGMWQKQEWAAQLDAVLASSPQPPPLQAGMQVPRDFVQQFARLNAPAVAVRWAEHLPPGLSPEFVRRLAARITSGPAPYFEVLIQGVRPTAVQEVVFQELLALGGAPPKADRQILEKWIKASTHPGLLTLPPLWDKDGKTWFKSLMALAPDDYELIVNDLTRWPQPLIPLWEALVGPHASAWMRLAGPAIPPGDWKKALPILEKMGEPILEELAGIAPKLREPSRTEIAKWLKGYKGAAPRLRAALGVPAKGDKREPRR